MILEVVFQSSISGLVVGFETTSLMEVDFGTLQKVSGEDVDPYLGDYIVTPTVNGFTLPTQQKLMTNDLTINKIPYYQVGNNSGGTTVYIGSTKEISIR